MLYQAPLAWETIVIRTRPDVKTPLVINDIALAQRYLRRGRCGALAMWGTEGVHTDVIIAAAHAENMPRASPQFLVTSYGACVWTSRFRLRSVPQAQHDVLQGTGRRYRHSQWMGVWAFHTV